MSKSKSQHHLFSMVKAVQHGHALEGLSKAGQQQVKELASRMSAEQVNDFLTRKKG